MKRYEQLAEEIARQIDGGVLRPGDRIPSVRRMRSGRRLSPATVMHAYQQLEARGLIQTRPRSGYYVSANYRRSLEEPQPSRPPRRAVAVDVNDLVFDVLDAARDRNVVGLGSPFPDPRLYPMDKLARYLASSARRASAQALYEGIAPGHAGLRRQIARRYLESGIELRPDDIVVTDGAMEALNLCLQSVTRPGDLVAVECPCFYAALQAIQNRGLRAVEVATHPGEGIELGALAQILETQPVKACWLMPNFQNPLGYLMPEQKKKELVALLARHRVVLVEDDAYGELYYGRERPKPAKAFDRNGLVMHCGTFSKALAPWYRVGWAAPGKFTETVKRRKLMVSIGTATVPQMAISSFLREDGLDPHLRRIRRTLEAQQKGMAEAVTRHFPGGTRITRPRGGYFLWLQLPGRIDALELHRRALEKNISVSPGAMFCPRDTFDDCMRLNYSLEWSKEVEAAIATLGRLTSTMLSASRDARVGEREALHDVAH